MQKNKNLIFILIDALRADHLGCYGYRKNTSPVIDNIARKSVIFNNAFCCVNVTDPSITSIFTGKYPKNNGIIHHGINVTKQEIQNFYNSKIKTLTIRLKEQGYKTYCIDWLGRWHKQGFDYYMGVSGRTKKRAFVDKILDILSKNKLVHRFATKLYHSTIFRSLSDKMSPFPIAKKLTKKAESIIENENDNPFFMFIHYWDTHAPYNCTDRKLIKKFFDKTKLIKADKYLKNIKNKEAWRFYQVTLNYSPYVNGAIARYDAGINYIDNQIGKILDTLKKRDKMDETVVIITADHGESLIDHDIMFEHHDLYDCGIRVPLIIGGFGLKKQFIVNQLYQHIDLLPTILDILKIRFKKEDFDGFSFYDSIIRNKDYKKRDYVFVEEHYFQEKYGIRTKDKKLIVSKSKKGAVCKRCGAIHGGAYERFYDLKKDPIELNNLFNEGGHSGERDKLMNILTDFYNLKSQEKDKINEVVGQIKV